MVTIGVGMVRERERKKRRERERKMGEKREMWLVIGRYEFQGLFLNEWYRLSVKMESSDEFSKKWV